MWKKEKKIEMYKNVSIYLQFMLKEREFVNVNFKVFRFFSDRFRPKYISYKFRHIRCDQFAEMKWNETY